MKKVLLVAVLGVFILGLVACGGASMESLMKDMIKVTNNSKGLLVENEKKA